MKYDVVIIGGGMAGLMAGIRCADSGLSTAIISAGVSALHFSSGCIDLLGRTADGRVAREPFAAMPEFLAARPGHPYARVGENTLAASLAFFKEETACAGLPYCDNGPENHFHVTALGTVKPAYLSPEGVFSELVKTAFETRRCLAILNFKGFRDFHPRLAAANMAKNPLFSDWKISTGTLTLPPIAPKGKNPRELRSIDIARLFDTESRLGEVAEQIKEIAPDADLVAVPAFLGTSPKRGAEKRLSLLAGRLIYEVPTLPPSLLGMRLDAALKARFAARGGVFIAGDRVTGGRIEGGKLRSLSTHQAGEDAMSARFFILATGSFFSGGLKSRFDAVEEPILNLALDRTLPRNTWYSSKFLGDESHPFLSFGVNVDENANPRDADGRTVTNLFCAGAVLSGYDPVREGSGSGVAIATGYFAAGRVMALSKAPI